MMPRECQFGHPVPKQRLCCEHGHTRVVILKCDVPSCSYVTDPPVNPKNITIAIELLKLHMKGAHNNHGVTNANTTETVHDQDQSDPNASVTCPECFKMFATKFGMKLHFKRQHKGVGRFRCETCQSSFASKTALKYHNRSCHPEAATFNCEKCDEISCDFDHYKQHRKTHESVSKVECDKCGCMLLKKHMPRHLTEVHSIEQRLNVLKTNVKAYPFKCDECEYVTKRNHDLKRHKEVKHSIGVEIVYPCEHCSKTFKYKSSRKAHEKKVHKSDIEDTVDDFEHHQTMETISGKFLFNENTAETKCVNCNKRGYFSLLSHDCENNNDGQVEELVKTTRKQSKN